MNRNLVAACVIAFLVSGCTITTLNRAEFAQRINAVGENTMQRGVFYGGSVNEYHYIHVKWEKRRNTMFAIPVAEVAINNQSTPSKDKRKWRHIISGPTSTPPFGYELLFILQNTYYFIRMAT